MTGFACVCVFMYLFCFVAGLLWYYNLFGLFCYYEMVCQSQAILILKMTPIISQELAEVYIYNSTLTFRQLYNFFKFQVIGGEPFAINRAQYYGTP